MQSVATPSVALRAMGTKHVGNDFKLHASVHSNLFVVFSIALNISLSCVDLAMEQRFRELRANREKYLQQTILGHMRHTGWQPPR